MSQKRTKKKSSNFKNFCLKHKLAVIILAVCIFGTIAFAGWCFCVPHPVRMSETSYGGNEQIDINTDKYNQLIQDKASFIVFIDQVNCITANKLREMLNHIADEYQIHIYHIMWSDISGTNLREKVKYYPSVAVIQNGQVVDALDANADAHTAYYNSEADLKAWLSRYVEL